MWRFRPPPTGLVQSSAVAAPAGGGDLGLRVGGCGHVTGISLSAILRERLGQTYFAPQRSDLAIVFAGQAQR